MANKFFSWKPVRIMSVVRLVRVCENHASMLRRSSHFRSLSLEETEFLSSFDMYQDGLLGVTQFRAAAAKYFDFES